MHRTDLPKKVRREDFEQTIRMRENPPEPVRVFRVIRSVCPVLLKGNWIGDFHRQRMNLHRNAEHSKTALKFLVEIRNRLRPQRDRDVSARTQSKMQIMAHEVEFNI